MDSSSVATLRSQSVLTLPDADIPPDPAAGLTTRLRFRPPSVVDVWRNLLLLTRPEGDNVKATRSSLLKQYNEQDFANEDHVNRFTVGSGVSYTVEARQIDGGESGSDEPSLVAVKTLNLFKQGQPTNLESTSRALEVSVATVLKEIRILTHAPLHAHENIVTLLGYYSNPNHHHHGVQEHEFRSSDIALVMEYSPYEHLREFLLAETLVKQANISLDTKARFIRDVAEGLKALHDCGIVHCDMKLENTLVFFSQTRGGYVAKLSDFGNSLLDLDGSNQPRTIRGTPHLSAPEVRRRGSSESGTAAPMGASELYKCDIFSFGLMAWEIILDGSPFTRTLRQGLELAQDEAATSRLVDALNALPEDELLLQALICSHEYEAEDPTLYQVVREVFHLSLWERPSARGLAQDIVQVFKERGGKLRDRVVGLPRTVDLPDPLPGNTMQRLDAKARTDYQGLKALPLVVQDNLIRVLQDGSNGLVATSMQERCDAKFDLAMCTIGGISTTSVTFETGLGYLEEAAELGSAEALSTIFRLYAALSRTIPPSLEQSSHPIARLERSLLVEQEPSGSYMSRRIMAYESLYQREALSCEFDIFSSGTYLLTSTFSDLPSRLTGYGQTLHATDLECYPTSGRILGVPQPRVTLLHLAARLNQPALVDQLLDLLPASLTEDQRASYCALTQGLLCSACEGGHLEMLKWVAAKKLAVYMPNDATLFHWLIKFPVEDTRTAMAILYMAAPWTLAAVDTGRDVHGAWLHGTALEFAIATNNQPLVDIFLAPSQHPKTRGSNYFGAIGWTERTFDLAVSLQLCEMIPTLVPIEKAFRASRRSGGAAARPFGLFEIANPHDEKLPFLIHGRAYSDAVEKTIDAVLHHGLCSINDLNEAGRTPLAKAVLFGRCDFTLEVLRQLIDKGAGLTHAEDVEDEFTLRDLRARGDRTATDILRLLLETGAHFPRSGSLLGEAVLMGNVNAVRMLCNVDGEGESLPECFTVCTETGETHSSLFIGAMVATKNRAQLLDLMFRQGADANRCVDLDSINTSTSSLLSMAVTSSKPDMAVIRSLIDGGASLFDDGIPILARSAFSRTSLVDGQHVAKYLLQYPQIQALVDVEWPGYGTPLAVACSVGNSAAAFALFEKGACVGDADNVEFLCDIICSVAQKPRTSMPRASGTSDFNNTQAFYRWRCELARLLRTLRTAGRIVQGRTDLHFAVETGNVRQVRQLIEEDDRLVLQRDDLQRLPSDLLKDKSDDLDDFDSSDMPRALFHEMFPLGRINDSLNLVLEYKRAQGCSEEAVSANTAAGQDGRRRRGLRLEASDMFGFASQEIMVPGQPLARFSRRFLFSPKTEPPAATRPPADSDNLLLYVAGHATESSIIASQYERQLVAEFGQDSEESLVFAVRQAHAMLEAENSNVTEIESHTRQLKDRYAASLGAAHPLMVNFDILLAAAKYHLGDHEKAIELQVCSLSALRAGETTTTATNPAQIREGVKTLCSYLMSAEWFEEAEAQAHLSIELAENGPGTSDHDLASAQTLLGLCHFKRGQSGTMGSPENAPWFTKSVSAFEKALYLLKRHHGGYHGEALAIMLQLNYAHGCLGHVDQAKSLCEEIVRQGEALPQMEKAALPSIVMARKCLILLNLHKSDLDFTIAQQEAVIKLSQAVDFNGSDLLREESLKLAVLYYETHQYHDALLLAQDVLDWRYRNLGVFHPKTLQASALTSQLFRMLEMWADAEQLMRRLLSHHDSQETQAMWSHSGLFDLLDDIAGLCMEQGHVDEAQTMWQRALVTAQQQPGKKARLNQAAAMRNLSEVFLKQGHQDKAEAITRRALGIYEHERGGGGSSVDLAKDIVNTLASLALIFKTQHRFQEAADCLGQALERYPGNADLHVCLMSVHVHWGQTNAARSCGAEIMKLYHASEPGNLTALLGAARHFLAMGDYHQVKLAVGQGVKIQQKSGAWPEAKVDFLLVLKDALERLGEEEEVRRVSLEVSKLPGLCFRPWNDKGKKYLLTYELLDC